MSLMEEFDHLKIQLKDIISATSNFDPNKIIGRGGFGLVYKGKLSVSDGKIMVACKRLDSKFGQGNTEFWKEIMMLSKYKHENLVSLLHFCIEGNERILVYEYASRGSLDRYLSDTSLSWSQRIKICIGAARALNYLHDPNNTQQRVIHRDVKSSNILLDEEWIAKVSDFGLSKVSPANQPQTYLISNVAGTHGYCDPLYFETGFLTKESDVYSFGVVLFEVMCGRLCCEYTDGGLVGILVHKWIECFEENRLDAVILHSLKEHLELDSLRTFSAIAYRCLKRARAERPAMAEIVQQLEIALEQQEVYEDLGKRPEFEALQTIASHAVPCLSYVSPSQLYMLCNKGFLVDDGKTWISINEKGQHYEIASAAKCIPFEDNLLLHLNMLRTSDYSLGSRFQNVFFYRSMNHLRLRVMTRFLTPHVTYIINLVYKCESRRDGLRIPFKYKLKSTRQQWASCVAHLGQDGWLRTELFQFSSKKDEQYFDIELLGETKVETHESFYIEGIEFRPVDFEEGGKLEDANKVNMQLITHSDDIDWEKKLPRDYTEIVKWSKDIPEWMPRKEVYLLFRKGTYIKNPQEWFSITAWFSINKNSKKRLMLPARDILQEEKLTWKSIFSLKQSWRWKPLPGSRFDLVGECCDKNHMELSFMIETRLLSLNTPYACYLVYKLPKSYASVFEGIVVIGFQERYSTKSVREHRIYLLANPYTPVIDEVSADDKRPSRTRKIKGHPKLRKDGWMEVQVWEFRTNATPHILFVDGYLKSLNEWNFTGLLVQGIEFRPLKVSFYHHRYGI